MILFYYLFLENHFRYSFKCHWPCRRPQSGAIFLSKLHMFASFLFLHLIHKIYLIFIYFQHIHLCNTTYGWGATPRIPRYWSQSCHLLLVRQIIMIVNSSLEELLLYKALAGKSIELEYLIALPLNLCLLLAQGLNRLVLLY